MQFRDLLNNSTDIDVWSLVVIESPEDQVRSGARRFILNGKRNEWDTRGKPGGSWRKGKDLTEPSLLENSAINDLIFPIGWLRVFMLLSCWVHMQSGLDVPS